MKSQGQFLKKHRKECRASGLPLGPMDVLDDLCCCWSLEDIKRAMVIQNEVMNEARLKIQERINREFG